MRADLAEARVCRALQRQPAAVQLADERIEALEGALVDMATRGPTLRDALVRVSAALNTAQHEAGLAARAAAEAEALAVVREMLPLVTALEPLNQQLEALRNRLGPSRAPMPFRICLQPAATWLKTAKAFVGDE